MGSSAANRQEIPEGKKLKMEKLMAELAPGNFIETLRACGVEEDRIVRIVSKLPEDSERLQKVFMRNMIAAAFMSAMVTAREELGIDVTKLKLKKGKHEITDILIGVQGQMVKTERNTLLKMAAVGVGGIALGVGAGILTDRYLSKKSMQKEANRLNAVQLSDPMVKESFERIHKAIEAEVPTLVERTGINGIYMGIL